MIAAVMNRSGTGDFLRESHQLLPVHGRSITIFNLCTDRHSALDILIAKKKHITFKPGRAAIHAKQ